MDIVGAKALKRRLGPNRADEAPPGSVDVPEDAPPVFHWVGIGPSAAETQPAGVNDEPVTGGPSLFRQLGLSFR